jgi:hypothetical protein
LIVVTTKPINTVLTSSLLRQVCTELNGSVRGFLWCTKVVKRDFVQGIILVHQFRTGINEFDIPELNWSNNTRNVVLQIVLPC